MKITEVQVEQIHQRENSRSNYHDAELTDLMRSIKENGLLQAIGLKKIGDGYEVVYGNRRFMAMKKLGFKDIPAVVLEEVEGDMGRDVLNLVENLKRSNLTSFDEGRIYSKLHVESDMSYSEIAARIGVPEVRIKNAVKVFHDLPEEYRGKVVPTVNRRREPGKISAGQAARVLSISQEAQLTNPQRKEFFSQVFKESWTSEKMMMIAKSIKSGAPIQDSIDDLEKIKSITLYLLMPKNAIKKVEQISGQPVKEAMIAWLRQMPGFRVHNLTRIKKYKRHSASATA